MVFGHMVGRRRLIVFVAGSFVMAICPLICLFLEGWMTYRVCLEMLIGWLVGVHQTNWWCHYPVPCRLAVQVELDCWMVL